jgi:hypothetical protein
MAMREWVRLPTDWIQDRGLCSFRWAKGAGSANTAALMALIAIAHNADDETGAARLTYDSLCIATSLSRAKLSSGLNVLEANKLIERGGVNGRSVYHLTNYRPNGWGKLPARRLYNAHGEIAAFKEFRLRNRVELNALKLYLLFIGRRSQKTNLAHINYDTINDYTGIDQSNIKAGLSVLAGQGLVHVEHLPSNVSEFGISNAYRIVYIDPRRHMGTIGRGFDPADFEAAS